MMQLFLAAAVIAAVALLALSSFRLKQRRLAAALAGLAVLLTIALAVVVWRQRLPPPQVDVSAVEIRLDAMHVTANGWRVQGIAANHSALDISSLNLRLIAKDCDSQQHCVNVAQHDFLLLLNIPAGGQYPVRYAFDDLNMDVEGELRWELEIVSADGYAGRQKSE